MGKLPSPLEGEVARRAGGGDSAAGVGAPIVTAGIPPTPNPSPQGGGGNSCLMIWLSPAFPVGGFAYSHGLEWAREAGCIRDAATLAGWLGDLLALGAPRTDAILLAAAWRATRDGNRAALAEINALALALAGSAERYLETSQQGTSFMATLRAAWPASAIESVAPPPGATVAYPVAVGMAAAAHGIALDATLRAYLTALVSSLVSAAIRLSAIGQTDGQRVVASLVGIVHTGAEFAGAATLDDLGQAAFRSDLASLRHETQYTRLFRS